jgi:hypothetical protein
MTTEASRHRRRIGGLLAAGRLPFDYKPEVVLKSFSPVAKAAARSIANYCSTRFPTSEPPDDMLDVPWFAEKVQKAIDEAVADLAGELSRETRMYETVVHLHGNVRKAADEMLAELLGDFANGVSNGYFPEVGVKLDRWCDALGKPRVVRHKRDRRPLVVPLPPVPVAQKYKMKAMVNGQELLIDVELVAQS